MLQLRNSNKKKKNVMFLTAKKYILNKEYEI